MPWTSWTGRPVRSSPTVWASRPTGQARDIRAGGGRIGFTPCHEGVAEGPVEVPLIGRPTQRQERAGGLCHGQGDRVEPVRDPLGHGHLPRGAAEAGDRRRSRGRPGHRRLRPPSYRGGGHHRRGAGRLARAAALGRFRAPQPDQPETRLPHGVRPGAGPGRPGRPPRPLPPGKYSRGRAPFPRGVGRLHQPASRGTGSRPISPGSTKSSG